MIISGENIYMTRGDTEVLNISLELEDGDEPLLEDGDTLYFTVKTSPETPVKTIQKIVTDFGNEGVAEIVIEHDDTKSLRPGRYVYDVQVTKADGTVYTPIKQRAFVLEGDVTHE